jgi:hypothetical protein
VVGAAIPVLASRIGRLPILEVVQSLAVAVGRAVLERAVSRITITRAARLTAVALVSIAIAFREATAIVVAIARAIAELAVVAVVGVAIVTLALDLEGAAIARRLLAALHAIAVAVVVGRTAGVRVRGAIFVSAIGNRRAEPVVRLRHGAGRHQPECGGDCQNFEGHGCSPCSTVH